MVKAKQVKKPKPTAAKLKKKLWTIFSIYIRLRDADDKGIVKCCTCGTEYNWTDPKGRMQMGHFIPVKLNPALMFDEKNVAGQCSVCNGSLEGSQWFFGHYIIQRWGKEELDRLISMYRIQFRFTTEWLVEKIAYYRKEVDKMKKEKGI